MGGAREAAAGPMSAGAAGPWPLLGGAQATRAALGLGGEVGTEVELEGGVLDGAGGDGHGLELGEVRSLRDRPVVREAPRAGQHPRLVGADRLVERAHGAVQ